MRRRAVAILVCVAATLVVLEAALQVLAYVQWSREREATRPAGRVVLCVGDSLTYGLGATSRDRAWPACLGRLLSDRGGDTSVVGGAWPGQNSADVLRRLPDQLASLRPDVLCVLVGWNDGWSRPLPSAPPALGGDAFPLRWRTRRLLALLSADVEGQLQGAPAERASATPFVGAWHVGAQDFYFGPDGTAVIGGLPMPWTLAGDRILVTRPDGEVVPVRWRMAAGELWFGIVGWPALKRARRGLAQDSSGLEAAEDLLDDGRVDEAVARLEAALDGADAARAHARLAMIRADRGDRDAADVHVTALRTAYASGADPEVGEQLAIAESWTGSSTGARRVAREVVASRPGSVGCWRIVVDTDPDPAARSATAAALGPAIAAEGSAWTRALLLLERAVAEAPLDPAGAIADAASAREHGAGQDEVLAALRRAVAAGADVTALQRAVDRAPVAAPIRAALGQDLRRATAGEDDVFRVLDGHLRMIVGLGRAAGARVVLLGYPFAMPRHEDVVAALAAELRVPFVSMHARFERELATTAWSDWFVDEIHCTDRGYALMAELVAPFVSGDGR
ncbi:MAG: SGNH/GDSL hydrolase family protein [Planctomycetes bacterium]|nr:SGNH/GDSL hydrolase family protein [Planctomycetota bacterium]